MVGSNGELNSIIGFDVKFIRFSLLSTDSDSYNTSPEKSNTLNPIPEG